ncbi:MAG: GDP-L-fucose synthase [Candidatus Saccharibacteria bacterium]
MQKDSKIYIAGHRGLVGSAIWRYLEKEGYSNLIGKTHADLDLIDQGAVDSFFEKEKPEYVFLAAAKVGGINANNTYRADFIYSNLAIQDSIISASYKNNVKKLLFLGSVCIYPKHAALPVREDSLLTGELEYTNEPYALAKIAGIKLSESYNLQYGTNYVSVMPANLYGENDNFDLEKSHVIPALIRKLILCKYLEDGDIDEAARDLKLQTATEESVLSELKKHGIEKSGDKFVLKVWGSGKPYREFMHSDDMAEACVYVMNNVDFADLSHGMEEVRNTHINLGTGKDITIRELVEMIKEIVGTDVKIEFDTSKPDGTFRRYMDVSKVHSLGWHHKIEIQEGLQKTITWYRENRSHL